MNYKLWAGKYDWTDCFKIGVEFASSHNCGVQSMVYGHPAREYLLIVRVGHHSFGCGVIAFRKAHA